MPDGNGTPVQATKPSGSNLRKDVADALIDVINTKQHKAVFSAGPSGEIRVDLNLHGTARDAAKTFLMNQAQKQL